MKRNNQPTDTITNSGFQIGKKKNMDIKAFPVKFLFIVKEICYAFLIPFVIEHSAVPL